MAHPSELRRQFPAMADQAYFQWAYRALLPTAPLEAAVEALRGQAQRGADARPDWFETYGRLRHKLAAWHGTDVSHVAFMPNTSWGLSLVANGMDWAAKRQQLGGDPEVVIPAGEFPANAYPWMNLARQGVALRVVAADAKGRVGAQALLDAIGPNTVLVAASHVSFHTGYRLNVAQLAAGCRQRGVFCVVDGAQSVGWAAIDFEALGCDVLTGVARKFWCALDGLDYFLTSERIRQELTPTAPGPFSVKHDTDYLHHVLDWKEDASKFANGAIATPQAYALEAAVDFFAEAGKEAIEARVLELNRTLRSQLTRAGIGFEGQGWDEGEHSAILRINEVRDHWPKQLKDAGVSVSLRGGGMRVGVHGWNNEEDIDRLLSAIG